MATMVRIQDGQYAALEARRAASGLAVSRQVEIAVALWLEKPAEPVRPICWRCGTQAGAEPMVSRDGKVFHPACAALEKPVVEAGVAAPICFQCDEPITGRIVETKEKGKKRTYHYRARCVPGVIQTDGSVKFAWEFPRETRPARETPV